MTSRDVFQDYGSRFHSTVMAPIIVKCCISIVKWTPVLFITAVLVWSYYAYVLQLCLCKLLCDL